MESATKSFVEKCALKCLASGGIGNLVKIDNRSQAFMFTQLGKNTPFSNTNSRWQEQVTPEHYTTLVSEDMQNFYTVLVNRVMMRVHLVDLQQAVCIEGLTGRAKEREASARSMKNRIVVSTSPVMLSCVIPECLYKHKALNQEPSAQRASELFSQASHQLLAHVSERMLSTKTAEQLYPLLKEADEAFSSCFGEDVMDVEAAEYSANRKFGASQLEQMALLFILTQSKMRMKLDISSLKLAKRNQDAAIAAVAKHRSHSSSSSSSRSKKVVEVVHVDDDGMDEERPKKKKVEARQEDDDEEYEDDAEEEEDKEISPPPPPAYTPKPTMVLSVPKRHGPISTLSKAAKQLMLSQPRPKQQQQPQPAVVVATKATPQPIKKRKRSLLTHAQQDQIVVEYSKCQTPEDKRLILDEHKIESHDIANWKRRHELEALKVFKLKQKLQISE